MNYNNRKEATMEDKKIVTQEQVKNSESPPKDAPVEVKIDKKNLENILKVRDKVLSKNNEFFSLSQYIVEITAKQKQALESIKALRASLDSQIKDAFNKLKLDKNYRWKFDGVDSFVGTKETLITKKAV